MHVPDAATEALRDLERARDDAKKAERAARQQLSKFLLRHGRKWSDGSNWTKKHLEWIGRQGFEHEAQRLGLALAIAFEAVAGERPAERCATCGHLRPGPIEAPVSGRQARAQAREVPGLGRHARDQERGLGRAFGARQQGDARGLGLEARAFEPGAAPAGRRASRRSRRAGPP